VSPELEEFRQRVISHAKLVISRASKVESEASTNASLVQPFLTTLGYDVGNPDEVSPEHHADLRCEKTATNDASFLAIVCGFILIKSVHTA
jgi:hypothetical protein